MASDRLRLCELRAALDCAHIRPLYQPIVRMTDRALVAVEVLARLAHPVRGIIEPDMFMPQIEEAGLARPLTEAVGYCAFREWGSACLDRLGLSLALNVPLDVLLMPTALAWLDRARESAGIPAGVITLELTETQPVTAVRELAAVVSRFRRRGYAVAIDDVGPSLRDHRDLLKLDFSSLKLDKNVVQKSMHCAEADAFLRCTTADAHSAGMAVVAEGIATPEIWTHTAVRAIDLAQGFFVGRPMPARLIHAWHRQWRAGQFSPTDA